jgi:hypothetical protein|tara:strand:- start:4279 stop:4482 length:204 start_codon:yes stop_codon:yes gene_type:complete
LIPIFFSLRVTSLAVASACLLDLQVAITKKSAIDVLFFKSIILILSVLASSRIALIFATSLFLLLLM